MLPGVAPTGKCVECGLVVIVHFRYGKLAHEHIYWDQSSVLVQLGFSIQRNCPLRAESRPKSCRIQPCLPTN
jgi:carboxymethylenebutenolidase